jgi:hypothetical protein
VEWWGLTIMKYCKRHGIYRLLFALSTELSIYSGQ